MSVRIDGGLVRLDAAPAPRLAQVVAGSLQVFAARLEDGRPEGPRRFLFECGPGDPLLFLPTRRVAQHGLIAVGRADIEAVPAGDAAACDGWVSKLATSLATVPPPPGALFAEPLAERLAPGTLLGGPAEGAPRWLRVREGVVRLQDLTEVGPDDGAVPLRAPLWALAQGDEEVALGDDAPPTDPLEGPLRLLELVLAALARLEAADAADRLERLERRRALAAEASRRSALQLAEVLAPEGAAAAPPAGGGEVFRAAALVGRALGLELRAPSEEGAGGAAVEAIASGSHVRTRAVLLRDDWWRQDCGPLVAFDGPERRPVALLPAEGGGYERVDPASGARERVTGANEGALDRVAFMFYEPLAPPGELVAGLLRGGRGDVARLLLASAVAAALGLALPRVLATIIDQALPAADRPRMLELSLVLLVAAFGAAVFRAAAGYGAVRLSTLVDHRLQSGVIDRLLRLPLAFHRRYASGDLVTRAMAIHEMRARVGSTLMAALVAALMSVVHLAVLIGFGGKLALLALGTGAVCALVVLAVGVRMRALSRAWLEVSSASQGLVNQLVGGVTKLRVGGATDRAVERFAVHLARQQELRLRQNALRDVIATLNGALPVTSSLALYALTAYVLRQEAAAAALLGGVAPEPTVTPGGFLAFQASFAALIAGITLLGNSYTDLLDAGNLWERARPIVETAPEGRGGQADPGRLRGRLAVERVTFRYREGGPAILGDVTIRAEPGEMIALVGGSGSGKSTLLRVVLGLEQPDEGSVLYDDQDLSGLDVAAVRRQIGTVMQEGRITAGSILTNVSGGRTLGLSEVGEAVKAAGLDEDVEAMPMGLHTVISEGGVNLSGGQRQRLLLARAFAMRPTVFVLDEATSALDNRTQAIVTASLARLNATRVVVAHRLSTIQGADRIYVLERGRIVQEGTFAALSAVDGPFRALVRRQLPEGDVEQLAAAAGPLFRGATPVRPDAGG